MNIDSHAARAFYATSVTKACRAYLDDRERRENERKERHIAYHMNKPWWKFPAKTREQAIKKCIEPFWGYSWELGGILWAGRVLDLQILCEASGDNMVYISAELFECIAPFMENENEY